MIGRLGRALARMGIAGLKHGTVAAPNVALKADFSASGNESWFFY